MDEQPLASRLPSPVASGRRIGRRSTLKGVAGAGLAGLAALGFTRHSDQLAAQDATPAASPEAGTADKQPAFLFVQLADHGSWTPKPGEDGVYLLTLDGPGNQTLFFSDRPDRIVGTVPTETFLGALGFTPFESPNAAVVVQTPDGTRDVLVIELMNPVYSQAFGADASDTLTYEARVLAAYQGDGLAEWAGQPDDDQLPQDFSQVSLFIDDCADLTGCYWTTPYNQLVYEGEIPYGPWGRCWDWSAFKCRPCKGGTNEEYDALCNAAYPRCKGACVTDTCGPFGNC